MIYGTPTIVTNGLVLNLDAASPKAAPTRNLLHNTNELTNTSAWLLYNSTLTASAAIAPDGTNTAYAWNIATSGTSSLVRLAAVNSNSPISSSIYGGPYTFSVYVKNRNCTATDFNLSIYNGPYNIGNEPIYTITNNFTPTGVITPTATFFDIVRRSEDVGNGWYRISYSTTVTSSLNTFNVFFDIENGSGTKVAGEGIYIWGPQFEAAPAPTPYQPVTSTNRSWPSLISSITGSMINRPTFSSANGGNIVFDGINDYVPIASLPALGTNHSLSFWMRIISITAAETQIFMPAGDVASISITNSRIGSWNGTTYRQSSTTMPTGVWFNFVMTCNGSTTIFYLNGNVDLISATTGNFQAGTGYLCSVGPAIARYLNANIGNVAFYNRALSQQEITQNYNALKSRYGLS